MPDKKVVSLLVVVSSLFFPFISRATDVTLSVSDGAGVRGSVCCNPLYPESNRVELGLENTVNVRQLYVDICNTQLGTNLLYNSYELTSRTQGFTYSVTQLSQCIRVRFETTPGKYITPGSGPLAILYFDIAEFAPGNTCTGFTITNVLAVDANGYVLNVIPDLGAFCFYHCGVNQHCNDGVFCNGEEWCFAGSCQPAYADPCAPLLCNEINDKCYCTEASQCSDGLWCNGAERCVSGSCKPALTKPCTDDQDPCTSDCNEGTDTCEQVCISAGPWESCCQSSSTCSTATQCIPEVWLTVGHGTGAPGSTDRNVSVSLKNPSDKVQGIQAKICSEYLSFSNLASDCIPCPVGGRCVGTGWACQLSNAGGGCWQMLMYTQSPNAYINYGDGPVATLKYDVSSQAPYGQCRDLVIDTETLGVSDPDVNPLVTMPRNGRFCFPCTTDQACFDGNDCTTESCVNSLCVYNKRTSGSCNDYQSCTVNDRCVSPGVCVGDDKCPDNSTYCDGKEYCSGGACSSTGDPCGALTCDEGADVCQASDVAVKVLNAYGRSGVIELALDNSDEVGEVQVDVCDIDRKQWLTIAYDDCTTTSRSGGFYCVPTNLGEGCVRVHLWSPFPLDAIEPGSGTIARLNYTVDPQATILATEYADIVPQNSLVEDVNGGALSVTPLSGRLYPAEYCEGDFDCDTDVDANDVALFVADFGRSLWYRPCTGSDPCNGDFDCDSDVDAGDVTVLVKDFGRSLWSNPCPPCTDQFDCQY